MSKVKKSIHIDKPTDQVWKVLADLGAISKYHPYIDKSYYSSENKDGINASRICEFSHGTKLEETAIIWENGKSLEMKSKNIGGPKSPVYNSSTLYDLFPEEEGTRLVIQVSYTPEYGLLGKVLDIIFIKPQFNKIVINILKGLKIFNETGQSAELEIIKNSKLEVFSS